MTHPSRLRLALCAAILGIALLAPAAASASKASIISVLESYSSKIDIAEGHVATAVGKYEENGNAAGVETAISKSVGVLSSLKAKIGGQPASNASGKKGKAKIEKGLGEVISAYRRLKAIFGKQVSPETAKAEAEQTVRTVKKAQKNLVSGAKLLAS